MKDFREKVDIDTSFLYNPETGHRIKDNDSKIPVDWIHPKVKAQGILTQNWNMTQCLFGEHLLTRYPEKIVALVEESSNI